MCIVVVYWFGGEVDVVGVAATGHADVEVLAVQPGAASRIPMSVVAPWAPMPDDRWRRGASSATRPSPLRNRDVTVPTAR